MGDRFLRALTWAVVGGGGIAAGLAIGSALASNPLDGRMLSQLGGGAGAVAAIAGFTLPVRPRRRAGRGNGHRPPS
jgi:hypothetical protein